MMDIGGGSTEFVLDQDGHPVFVGSYIAGVAVLKNTFQKHDPIAPGEIKAMQSYLDQQFKPVREILGPEHALTLVGAAGIFDVLSGILGQKEPGPALMPVMLPERVMAFGHWILQTPGASLLEDHRIPPERVELLPAAMVLIGWVIKNLCIRSVCASSYALKEGALIAMVGGGIPPHSSSEGIRRGPS
jgi:exopolyphosphatase/pppGpp-phosphohydrolase